MCVNFNATVGHLITKKNKLTDTRQTTFTCKACKLVVTLLSPTCAYSVSFGSRLHSHLRSTSLSKPHSGTVQKSFVHDPEISNWLCENLAEGKGSNCPPLFWR
jgi:hypothetical protein